MYAIKGLTVLRHTESLPGAVELKEIIILRVATILT